jgi:hypothetical protein
MFYAPQQIRPQGVGVCRDTGLDDSEVPAKGTCLGTNHVSLGTCRLPHVDLVDASQSAGSRERYQAQSRSLPGSSVGRWR